MKIAGQAHRIDAAPSNRAPVDCNLKFCNIRNAPYVGAATAQVPTLSKMMAPAILRGPAQGPPPIANNPNGNVNNDKPTSPIPSLN